MFLQRTIRQRATVEGIGLHTGQPAKLTFCPAPEGTGIYFVRRDLPGSPAISTRADRVTATSMATTLGGDAFSVSTVEHCLSSIAALRIEHEHVFVTRLQQQPVPRVIPGDVPDLQVEVPPPMGRARRRITYEQRPVVQHQRHATTIRGPRHGADHETLR